MFKNILIPTDGSVVSRKAIKAGIQFAKSLGAKVTGYSGIVMLPYSMFGDGDIIDKGMEETSLSLWNLPINHCSSSCATSMAMGGRRQCADLCRDQPGHRRATGGRTRRGRRETRRAIEAARVAQPAWRARTAGERAKILRRWYELLLANQEDLALD
jgi:delta 1-pyrroline-5-carboxylate dehydrogenase